MKYNNSKKKASGSKGFAKGKRSPINEDSFFESKKRRKMNDEDTIIDSDLESEEEGKPLGGDEEEDLELEAETPGEARKRMATELIEKIRKMERKEDEEDEDAESDEGEKEGLRDTRIANILQQEQLEESGRVKRLIASKVQKPETADGFRLLVKHRHSVTAVALSEDDLKGYSASKDGIITHWDVESGKGEKYQWPSEQLLKSHGARDPQGRATKHSKHVLALAVSSDGRYLASGGLDRHVHLWDTRTREHIQAFQGHKGPVSCLTFRQGTSELFSGSFDRTIKTWNAEDRTYMSSLFGHQSEVLTIDCLRKERVLTVGRDRSMQLWKIPEESRLVFRASSSSLESGCFVSNDEFLTGSDDGSIEFWNMLRKKPVCIVKNAHVYHPPSASHKYFETSEIDRIPNGHIENLENGNQNPESNCSSAHSWVSSVSVCRSSDLAASGAGNGCVRLWAIGSETKSIQPLFDLPLAGFVNSLAFAKSGRFLVAGVGQEPRLGRWGRLPAARNGVAIQSLKLT